MTVRSFKRWPGATVTLGLALTASVAVAACGSTTHTTAASSKASGSTSSSTSSTAGAHETPVKVGLINSGTGATAEGWVYQAAQIGARAANAAGGLMGHPIEIDYCDDQGSVQTAAVCAQKLLVQDKDLMLVGDDGTYDTGVVPVLQSTHTILFSAEGANQAVWSSPNAFILGIQLIPYHVFPQFQPPGKHNVAEFTADIAAAIAGAKSDVSYYAAKGDAFTVIPVPLTAADFSTPCLQAKNFHANVALATFNTLTQFVPMAQACKQLGVNLTWVLEDSVISNTVLQGISTLGLKSYILTSFSPPAYAAFIADSAKYGISDSNTYNEAGMDAYVGFKLLPSVVAGAGSLNPQAIKAWLDNQTAFNTQGFTPPINLTPANHPLGPFVAVKNTCVYAYTVQTGGKLVAASSAPICLK